MHRFQVLQTRHDADKASTIDFYGGKDVFGGQLSSNPNHDSVMRFIFMSGHMNKQNMCAC
jgi:hypothetical protein